MEDQNLSIITLFISLIAIVLAVVFYLKSRRYKKTGIVLKKYEILKRPEEFPQLKITYDGENLDELVMTRIAFFNIGNMTINNTDIPEKAPVRLIIPQNIIVYDATILFEKNKANSFSLINREDNSIEIHFDFIDKGEGCVIQLLHNEDSKNEISFDCSLKGTSHVNIYNTKIKELVIRVITFITVIIGMSILGYYSYTIQSLLKIEIKLWYEIPIVILLCILLIIVIRIILKIVGQNKIIESFKKII